MGLQLILDTLDRFSTDSFMKTETLQALLVARILHSSSRELCNAADRYLASAGLMQLQDALELTLYAALIELGRDETKRLESLSFDELIAEVRKEAGAVPKSGTLRALNRERVNVKHYGQVADPVTVVNYFNAASLAMNSVLRNTAGMTLDEIMLHELLRDGEEKEYIRSAIRALEQGEYRNACVEVRKALYIAIEEDYSIEEWADYEPSGTPPLGLFLQKKLKAPFYTRNKSWIAANVREPLDYIQIDHDRLRMDLLEWGVPPRAFNDLRYLIPRVFRFKTDQDVWITEDEVAGAREYSRDAALFAIDQAVFVLAKRQAHGGANPLFSPRKFEFVFATIAEGTVIREKADLASHQIYIGDGVAEYMVHGFTVGLAGTNRFARVTPMHKDVRPLLYGYVPEEMLRAVRTVDLPNGM